MKKDVMILIIILLIIVGAAVYLYQDEIELWINGGEEGTEYSKIKNEINSDMLNNNYTETDAENALNEIDSIFSTTTAQRVEQIYRLETANFKSEQYVKTGTAGMVTGAWADRTVNGLPIKPQGYPTIKITGADKAYIVFPSVLLAMEYLAQYLTDYGLDAGTQKWGSQPNYLATVQNQDTTFTA